MQPPTMHMQTKMIINVQIVRLMENRVAQYLKNSINLLACDFHVGILDRPEFNQFSTFTHFFQTVHSQYCTSMPPEITTKRKIF